MDAHSKKWPPGCKLLSWGEVRQKFFEINLELAEIIDDLSPSSSHCFIQVDYDYGQLIVDKGCVLTADGNSLKEHLSYASIPLGIVLSRTSEVFVEGLQKQSVPLNILGRGELFGTFDVMNLFHGIEKSACWSLSSGSRTIFTLPKLTNSKKLERLREYCLMDSEIFPLQESDQWFIFKSISAQNRLRYPWKCSVLFFSASWFKHLHESRWQRFNNYLFQYSWKQVQHAINRVQFFQNWNQVIHQFGARHLTPRPYLMETFRHLLMMAFGELPGITANVCQEKVPVEVIQSTLQEVYSVHPYHPTLFSADFPSSLFSGHPVYYSLSNPTLIEGSASDVSYATKMTNLKDIKQLFDSMKTMSEAQNKEKIPSLTYIHNKGDLEKNMVHSQFVPETDFWIQQQLSNSELTFCSSGLFWRGCIQMRYL